MGPTLKEKNMLPGVEGVIFMKGGNYFHVGVIPFEGIPIPLKFCIR